MDEKKMEEKETAWKVTRKRKAKGNQGGDYRKCLLDDQVSATNSGSSKLHELQPHSLGLVGAVKDMVTLCLTVPSLKSDILVKVMMCMYAMCMYVMTCMYVMLYMCQTN